MTNFQPRATIETSSFECFLCIPECCAYVSAHTQALHTIQVAQDNIHLTVRLSGERRACQTLDLTLTQERRGQR